MQYKYQVSVFSNYYPTVALFETWTEASVYYYKAIEDYKDSCLVTISELIDCTGEAEYPLIEWY